MMTSKGLILLLLTLLPLTDGTHLTITCADGGSMQLPTNLNGTYLQVNNGVWGDPNGVHKQCIFAADEGFGWRWLKRSFTYRPYFPHVSFNVSEYMPVTVSQLHTLQVTFSAVIRGTGTYNLAFDLWFSADPQGKHITDEVMVWLVWTNRTIKLPIAINDGYNDYGYLTFKAGWKFHAFFLLANKIPFIVNFERLLRFAGVNDYLDSINLGSEVFSGTGETIVYAINIQLNDLSIRNANGCYDLSCAGVLGHSVYLLSILLNRM
jgi:hypothetical protein